MEIQSATGSAALEFGDTEPFRPGDSLAYVHVLLHGPVEAGARVYDDHFETLTGYFRELAADWRQARRWESLEGHLSLQATADRTGHIQLRVKLRDDGAGNDWRVEAVLILEAGQLQAIADGVARHLEPTAGAG